MDVLSALGTSEEQKVVFKAQVALAEREDERVDRRFETELRAT